MDSSQTTSQKNYRHLSDFLIKHIKKSGSEFTHTAIGDPKKKIGGGSYTINTDEYEHFLEIYHKHVFEKKKDAFLTERHTDFSPILIDLDLRYELKNKDRQYTDDTIKTFLKKYISYAHKYLNITPKANCEAFVMEKTKTYIQLEKKQVKDGIHIIFPFLTTSYDVQHVIRQDLIQDKEIIDLFKNINAINDVKDIIDECVIDTNNWLMYGSQKPNNEPYLLTKIYNFDNNCEIEEINNNKYTNYELIKHTSIRNKKEKDLIKIKEDQIETIRKLYESINTKKKIIRKKKNRKKSRNKNNINECENLETIVKIVDILSKERADNHNDWIKVGWCLFNIDHRLLDAWVDFSKKSEKSNIKDTNHGRSEERCHFEWQNMQYDSDGLNVGSLYLWAKHDNKKEFDKIFSEDIKNIILSSLDETHTSIAKVVHYMYKNEFVCCSLKKKIWYHYDNHRWNILDDGIILRQRISKQVFDEYMKLIRDLSDEVTKMENDDYLKEIHLARIKKLNNISKKLRTQNFKKNVFDECCELFYVNKFDEQLDQKIHLVGFVNGVYDLEEGHFRNGIPEDYISLCTNIEYEEFDNDDEEIEEVMEFLKQVLPKEQVRTYVLTLLSSFLSGDTGSEKFHIWTGTGGNGKSKIIELFEHCFGDYCCKLPVQIITRTRGGGEQASPALVRTKGKRFAVLQEPEPNEEINVGLMKELTGGDKIIARGLHQAPQEFKPQFKMIMTCNELPNVSANDNGTWRRITVVEFISSFVENPDPNVPFQFKLDDKLSQKMVDWPEAFMYILTNYHKKYRKFGIHEPPDVKKQTQEYKSDSDIYEQFFNSKITVLDESYNGELLFLDEIYKHFIEWFKQVSPNSKTPSRKDLRKNMIAKFGKCVPNKIAWKGLSYKFDEPFINEDNDLDL